MRYMASGLAAAPKPTPLRGMPPRGPHSMERVNRSEMPSSSATEPMPPGIPMPTLMRLCGGSSIAARRQQTLWVPSFMGSKGTSGTLASPASSGRNRSVSNPWRLYSGRPSTM